MRGRLDAVMRSRVTPQGTHGRDEQVMDRLCPAPGPRTFTFRAAMVGWKAGACSAIHFSGQGHVLQPTK
jgi:hypothetical protein